MYRLDGGEQLENYRLGHQQKTIDYESHKNNICNIILRL